jgi:hypothetical protein
MSNEGSPTLGAPDCQIGTVNKVRHVSIFQHRWQLGVFLLAMGR